MSKKIKITILFFIVGAIIICCSIFFVSHLKEKRNEKERIRNEELIQIKYNELINFARENAEKIADVSEVLIVKDIDPDKNYNYKDIVQSESEKVKQDFEIVFAKVFFINAIYTNEDPLIQYSYDSIDGTKIRIIYYPEDKKEKTDSIRALGKYGEVTEITDSIFVVYYKLHYT